MKKVSFFNKKKSICRQQFTSRRKSKDKNVKSKSKSTTSPVLKVENKKEKTFYFCDKVRFSRTCTLNGHKKEKREDEQEENKTRKTKWDEAGELKNRIE